MDSAEDVEREVVSQSLLRGLEEVRFVYNPAFDLGCTGEGVENEDTPPSKRKCRNAAKRNEHPICFAHKEGGI